MTKEQIENLPASRETDALIAVEFFGWRWLSNIKNEKKLSACFPSDGGYEVIPKDWSPSDASGERFADWDKIRWFNKDEKMVTGFLHYSTDITAAWTLVEKIKEIGAYWWIGSPYNSGRRHEKEWYAEIVQYVSSHAETASLAICRAALLWKLSQEQDDDQDTSRKRGGIADCG